MNEEKKETVEKQEPSLVAKEEKKAPVQDKAKKKKSRKWIFPTVLCCVSAGVGVMLGLIGYSMFGSKGPTVNYGDFFAGYDYASTTKYKSVNDVLNDKSLKDSKDQAIAVLNSALYKSTLSNYYLAYSKQTVTAKVGVVTTQDIEAVTYASPTVSFNQNISSSSVVHTADRFYDYNDGKVTSYREKLPSDWKNASPNASTYDSFLTERGKLLKRFYYLNIDVNSSLRSYKTSNKDEAKEGDYQEQSILGYDIGTDSVVDAVLSKDKDNYVVDVSMDYTTPTGFRQMAIQMKMTGGLSDNPSFSSVEMKITLDKDLNLKSSSTSASYNAKIGSLNAQCTSEDSTYYFMQNDPFKDDSGEIKEPKPNEETGDSKSENETRLVKLGRTKSGVM